ncbi:SRPBCC family protein [Natronobeatus ordinarius]|uniref:SRPBCC family protein n=1 Tax=Natronobeatus ordinarius TaxID=2963433 RepID=UPI0020CE8BA1|nr:SRPBCC family protein [Natronobeatus ordinarius]
MRTVDVSRAVRAQPAAVDRLLTPETIVEYEGSFTVRGIDETDDGWIVTAGSRGLQLSLRFEALEDEPGFYYELEGEDGPLEVMETTLSIAPENEGTRVSATSTVHMGVRPVGLADRIAAWKRKGELKRALAELAADVE